MFQKLINTGTIAGTVTAIAGTLAIVFGYRYDWGSLRNIGPGLFPVSLGVLVIALGAIVFVQGLLERSEEGKDAWQPRSLFAVLTSMVSFSVLLPIFGLIPAVIVLVLISCTAKSGITVKGALLLSAATALGVSAIFIGALRMPIPAFDFP